MKRLETPIVKVAEVRALNIQKDDALSFDYQYENGMDNYYLCVNGERTISFKCNIHRAKTYSKIQKMGLGLGWIKPQLTDEEEGLLQASLNGENPFRCTIMCSNPKLNEIN